MKNLIQQLSGYKTYIIAGATILYCVLGVLLNFMTIPAALAFIGTAGSIAALRGGVGKAQDILEVILEILKLIGQVTPAPTPAIRVPAITATQVVTGEAPIVATTPVEATPTIVAPVAK